MAAIQTSIGLQDNFTSVLYQVISSVNLGLSAMEDLHQTMNTSVDTTSIEAARDSINQATIAVQELDAAMQNIEVQMPDASTEPLQVPVQPDVPEPLVDNPEPLQVPVQWQSDNFDVFTSSGIERFQQEVQSTNNMLNTLNQTQSRIATQASQMDLFPVDAVADMNNVQNRLQTISQQIQIIEDNPLNMGTNTANAELEQLRRQLTQAVQEQENLNRAVEYMDIQTANEAYLRLSQTIGNTETYIRDNVDEQGRFNREIQQGANDANQLVQTIKGAFAAYATIQTVKSTLDLSDQLTATTARLNMMNDGFQTTQELQNMIFQSAERSRGSYQATADAVSKLGIMAGDAFGSSGEIVDFMEQVNKQFTIAGTETAGIEAAMLQLTQAMGSGVLRGEEYNSILEQAPNIIQSIADYMGVPTGQLKDMASEGQITADIVKAAMFAAADETNAKFESMPKTFSQIWTSFQNNALMSFQPVLEQMNEIANSEAFQEFVDNAIEDLSMVASASLEIFDLLMSVAGVVADNWSWLSPIIYGVTAALGIYTAALTINSIVQAINTTQKRIAAIQAVAHGAAITTEMTTTTGLTAAQLSFNAALYACPLTWIIVIIIALIAIFYAAIAAINHFAGTSVSATGIICGAFMVALAFIGNVLNTLWNLAIDVFVLIYNLVASVANFMGNAFIDPVGSICRLFFDLADTVLGILQALASAIDTIFGSNLADSVQGWRDSIGGWVDDTFGKGVEVMEEMNPDAMKLGRYDYGEAWDAGYNFGEGIADFDFPGSDSTDLTSALLGGAATTMRIGNNIGNKSLTDDIFDGALTALDIGNSIGDIGSGVEDIAGNTDSIVDSMDITEEDLKYLRDIAEQEAINRFTTAEITIEQTNHNTVSGQMDLDGIVSGLTDAANEAVDMIAEGVHE